MKGFLKEFAKSVEITAHYIDLEEEWFVNHAEKNKITKKNFINRDLDD